MIALLVPFHRFALRLVIAALFAGAAIGARAVVFTTDYDRLTVLPAQTGNPADVDWRAKGTVTPVKNEGACDASWAFAVTQLVEGDHQIRTGQLFSLSEQELLDCTGSGSGCDGGSPIAALRTLITKGGLTTTAAYPYTARKGTCKATSPVATIPGAGRVPPGDEVSLQNYVSQGPVLALVNASAAFNAYHGGIFNGPCSDNNPTQAVLIVGYATTSSGDYWVVKNSLGASWGDRGYIHMVRHQNLCGIANFAIAVSNDPLPPPVATPTPTLNTWAVGLLVLAVGTIGFVALHRPYPTRLGVEVPGDIPRKKRCRSR
jgi:C1A family cysteine protease